MDPIQFDAGIFGPILLVVMNVAIFSFFLVLNLLDRDSIGRHTFTLYQFFSIFGALAFSSIILRDLFLWPISLKVAIIFFLLNSLVLILALLKIQQYSKTYWNIVGCHFLLILPVSFLDEFHHQILACALYGGLVYGYLGYRMILRYQTSRNGGFFVLSLPGIIVASVAPIQSYLVLNNVSNELVYTIVLSTYIGCYVLLCFGFLASILVDNRKHLAAIANRDPLTNLLNRRGMQHSIQTMRPTSDEAEMSLIVADIDFFKKINDNYGHDAGDQVLKDFGNILTDSVRTDDACARLGGEEFAILLPNTANRKAICLAERIRKVVEQHSVEYEGNHITITSSFGVATLPYRSPFENLLNQADKALYQAKENGRNKVCAALQPQYAH